VRIGKRTPKGDKVHERVMASRSGSKQSIAERPRVPRAISSRATLGDAKQAIVRHREESDRPHLAGQARSR
jgi:hypothetical protein